MADTDDRADERHEIREATTDTLIWAFALRKAQESTTAAEHALHGLVVDELRRRGHLTEPGSYGRAVELLKLAELDTSSSASRQHYIDTGEYLRPGQAWSV